MHCYLTIDLEDYKHATMIDMGLDPLSDVEQTKRGVDRIISTVNKVSGAKEITFFTTGQVARSNPELIRRLSRDGHEIACHTNEHEYIYDLSREEFKKNILESVSILKDCSGQDIAGFRAPNFSIDQSCAWAYQVLSECGLAYDASMIRSDRRDSATAYDHVENTPETFYEFPLYSFKFLNKISINVIGGSYFRLLPVNVILDLMKKAVDNGYVPIIYLHPSDLDDKFSAISMSEMRALDLLSRVKWKCHQKLWTTGTKSAAKKLELLLREFPNKGTLLRSLPIVVRS